MDLRREILRNVILCQALEPMGKKPSLTTRLEDAPVPTKPEYLVIASVNSCWAFYDLADRILEQGKQPDCIFDLAYEAQKESARNRLGGKVNFGQIQLLVPLVAAQVLEYMDSGTHENVEAILVRTGDVLRNTTEQDIEYLEKFIHLGYQLSMRHHERIGRPDSPRLPVLRGKFRSMYEACRAYQNIHAVREIFQGYPYSQQVYRFLLHNIETGILPASELVHRFLLPEIGRPDVAADFIAVGLYLLLTKHPEGVLFV
jgi:hypothetical protein